MPVAPCESARRSIAMAGAGIVRREVQTSSPVRVVYSLTEKGRELIPVMGGIAAWARSWLKA